MLIPAGTYADRRAWAAGQLGQSRQTPAGRAWTPRTDVDDCALFQSAMVFGERSYACWNVDGFKTVGGGTYHPGAAGLAPGDVVLFDWDGNGIGNHTENADTAPDAAGNFRTIGANGTNPALVVAIRQRSTRYVLGYFRPAWSAPAGAAPQPPTTTTTTPVGDLMSSHIVHVDSSPRTKQKGTYDAFLANPDTIRCAHLNATQETYWAAKGVPVQGGIQPPQVLDGFEQVKGKGASV